MIQKTTLFLFVLMFCCCGTSLAQTQVQPQFSYRQGAGPYIIATRRDADGTTTALYNTETKTFSNHTFIPDKPKPLVRRIPMKLPPSIVRYPEVKKPKQPVVRAKKTTRKPASSAKTVPWHQQGPLVIKNPYYTGE